jgi:eukaryotic-like serine/threonine-protein kinase
MSNKGKELYEFGPYRLDPEKRVLLRDREPIPLQMKAFETLLALVRHSEDVVLKDELMKAVWPDTFVEESNLTYNISVLRKTLGDDASERRYIVTIPGRGYRFIEKVRTIPEEEILVVEHHSRSTMVIDQPNTSQDRRLELGETDNIRTRRWILGGTAVIALAAVVGYLHFHRAPKLTGKDTIVLAEFVNTTGDTIFDGTLRQGLAAQLEQSPYLNLLSDRKVAQTLTLMTQPPQTKLTAEVAREVCQRSGSTALLEGTIAQVGTRYLLTLKATDCANGDSLASAAVQASDKNHVLDALGKAAAEMREELGESLASVQKYDVPLQNVTTSSLDALQAYSLGQRALYALHDGFKAVSFYQRAVKLDPNFAMAYARLGVCYFNSRELTRASENLEKAYELRDRLSEPEKLYIEAHHADIVTGDVDEARKTYELWSEIYPRDIVPLNSLGVVCSWLGLYDESLRAYQAALKLDPNEKTVNSNVVSSLTYLGRVAEAKATATRLLTHDPDDPVVHGLLYDIHFLENDTAGMQQDIAWHMSKPNWKDSAIRREAKTAAYSGHLAQSLDLTRRAIDAAETADRKEVAALYDADEAVHQALVGNMAPARQLTKEALALARDEDIDAAAALAFALIGDAGKSTQLVDQVSRQNPKYAPIQLGVLPEIRAATILSRDPRKAIEVLAVATPYELGPEPLLYPAYFRGYAYIATKQGPAAVAEFQKIVDHPGITLEDIVGALAHLGLARAYVATGDTSKAKAEYNNFLTLWKDADPDILTLKQAKAEYGKLQ